MKTRLRLLPPLTALVISLAAAAGAATPPAEKLLPPDTFVVMTIPDWDKSFAAAKDFSLAQLWRDPAMRAFTEKFEQKFRGLIGEEDKNFERDWQEFKPLIRGQITLGVLPGEAQAGPGGGPDMVFLLDVKDQEKQLRAFIEKCEKRDADDGRVIQRETVRGVKFARTLPKEPLKNNDDGPAKKKSQPYVGQSGSLLLFSESTKALEKVLARQDGVGAGLDENPIFERARTTMGRDAQAFGWVNVKAFADMLGKLPAGAGDANPLGLTPARVMDALGLGGLDGVALAARQSGEGTHIEAFVQAPQARRKGLLGILTPEAKEAGPLPFVGGDAAKFTRVRLDGQKAFATLERMITDFNPQMAGMVTLMLESVGKDKDPSFDLRKQVIGNLGADFVTIQKAPRGAALADLSAPPSLFLVGSPRPEALLQALRTVSPLPPTEREFLGRKIYSLPMMPGMGGPGGGKGQLSLSTTGGYLAISADAAMLEEVLRNTEANGKPLSEVPGLAEAAQKVGGFNTGWFGYENQSETLRLVLETLKKDPAALDKMFASPLPASGAAAPNLKPMKDLFDFTLLPPFEAIAKYFGFSVQSGAGTPEGISFKAFVPVPAGLKK